MLNKHSTKKWILKFVEDWDIIKDGKFADGIVGAYSQAKFEEFLNNNVSDLIILFKFGTILITICRELII